MTSHQEKKRTIIGIIPQYPSHTQQNIYAKVRMPPIGIVSVLSQVRHRPDCRAYAIDENNYSGPVDSEGVPDHAFLQKRDPAQFALFYGGMSNSIQRMFSLAGLYKGFGATTIAGGSHVDALPEEALRSGIDIVVHGEGEQTIAELLDILPSGGLDTSRLKSVRGISFLDRGRHVFTGKREPIHDLDSIQDTDLTLIKFLGKRWNSIPIARGRGCNFNCEFCVVNRLYGGFKTCSSEMALRQIISYADMGYRRFFFTDDNFAQDIRGTIRLCKSIGDYRKHFRKKIWLTVQVRSDIAEHDELIEAMRYAGVKTLAIGYESPIDEELRAMRKGVTVDKLVTRTRKLRKHFYIHGMFIFGYPSFKDSVQLSSLDLERRKREFSRFFRKSRLDTVQVLNAVPLPGTELRRRLEEEDRILPQDIAGWDKYDGSFLCYRPEAGVDAQQLQEMPRLLMKKRYLGSFPLRWLNYGYWMHWSYYATIGFPVQISVSYVRGFFSNIFKGRKQVAEYLSRPNLFHEPLIDAWQEVMRKWRNLSVRTYGAQIVKRWSREYKKMGYAQLLQAVTATS
jgi:radical SAM superfamily enzyme YgiQ (UPF0313 family)